MPLLIFLTAATIYLLPGLIAVGRGHVRQWSIVGLNLGLGWTIIGWIVLLAWACRDPKPATVRRAPRRRLTLRSARTSKEASGPANDNRLERLSPPALVEQDVAAIGDAYVEWLEAGECLEHPQGRSLKTAPPSAA